MAGICADRVVVITGAGRGLGRAHALAFAREGASVVVNDPGAGLAGEPTSEAPADSVVREIQAQGGAAVANKDDVSTAEGAAAVIGAALQHFGRLDVVVNNAGILRDRMVWNMAVEDFDAVMAVHVRSTFLTTKAAAQHWRAQQKAGEPVDARIINTSSPAGLYGNVGQANYSAAKAAIAALTLTTAAELARYGVTVNAIAPVALTRMTESLPALVHDVRAREERPEEFQPRDPANVSPLVVWLASHDAAAVTGRVFQVEGGQIAIVDGYAIGVEHDSHERRTPAAAGQTVNALLQAVRPAAGLDGRVPRH